MSIQIINLNKLLRLCALPENLLIGDLRDYLRSERDAAQGVESTARHFHYPWWSVAKLHVVGQADLRSETPVLVAANAYRKRLYPMLTEAFLSWFDELRRSSNESFGWVEERVHNHYPVPGLQLTVKVDNLLSLRIGDAVRRLVYPYYSEFPVLTDKWARVGIWLMRDALPRFPLDQMEILDVLRSRSFRGAELTLRSDEEAIFKTRFLRILELWRSLRTDYGLAA
jgi:hypothetical protein